MSWLKIAFPHPDDYAITGVYLVSIWLYLRAIAAKHRGDVWRCWLLDFMANWCYMAGVVTLTVNGIIYHNILDLICGPICGFICAMWIRSNWRRRPPRDRKKATAGSKAMARLREMKRRMAELPPSPVPLPNSA